MTAPRRARSGSGVSAACALGSRALQAISAQSRKYKDALRLADEARAGADRALAAAQLDSARAEVESRTARNADLRRQLLVLPGSQR